MCAFALDGVKNVTDQRTDKAFLGVGLSLKKKNILLLELLFPYFLDHMSAVLLVCDREKLSLPSGSQQANRVIMGDKECDFYGGDDDDNDDGDDDDNDDVGGFIECWWLL